MGNKYERAKSCAQQVRPIELQNMILDKIQGLQRNKDIEGGRYDKLGGQGLEMLAQRGQWEECLNLAEKQGPEVLNNFLMRFAKIYLKQG